MIDLHLHTYYSDGTLSPMEVVKRAATRGVMTIAITDHDGLNGIPEAIEAGRTYGVKVIPSIELSTKIDKDDFLPYEFPNQDIYMHILGYDIDINNRELNLVLEDIRKKRAERNQKMLSILNRIGYKLEMKDLNLRDKQDYIGKPNFALALTKRGYIQNPKEAFTPGKFLKHPEVKAVHREKIHVKKAISLIQNAGGQAVLAHPMKITSLGSEEKDFFKGLNILLDVLQQWGLDGMECRYSSHSKLQIEKLEQIAENRGLIVTSGSDFHGPDFDSDLDIGVIGAKG